MNRSQHAAIERAVRGLGYEFVHLEWIPRSGLVRIYIDKPAGVNVNDCARVSEHLGRTMAVEGFTVGSDAHTTQELGRSVLHLDAFEGPQELRQVIRGGVPRVNRSPWWFHLNPRYASLKRKLNLDMDNQA